MRVGIALGSNLGDRLCHLQRARRAVVQLPDVAGNDTLIAPVFQTVPLDCPPGAGLFLNSVVEIVFAGQPGELLRSLQRIEREAGRPADREINAARPLDLDILYAGGLTAATPELTLPHPRMLQRRFVLAPLACIRPGLILPGQTATVAEILAALHDDPATVAVAGEQW